LNLSYFSCLFQSDGFATVPSIGAIVIPLAVIIGGFVRWPSEAVDRQSAPTASEGHRTISAVYDRQWYSGRASPTAIREVET